MLKYLFNFICFKTFQTNPESFLKYKVWFKNQIKFYADMHTIMFYQYRENQKIAENEDDIKGFCIIVYLMI